MNQIKPVILLSSERSGTNLLRAMLDTHSGISSPPPTGMIDTLPNIAHRYLLPWYPSRVEALAEDLITLTKTHMNPWDIELSVEMIVNDLADISFWGVFRRVNEIYARQYDAQCWFTKEPGMCRHVFAIHAHIPDARFIYLVRDGRDVAASLLQQGLHEAHIYPAARRWALEQRLCLTALSDPAIADRILMVKYEDLVASPEPELEAIMQFIGLDMRPEQLNFHREQKIRQHAEKSVFWTNLAKPINTGSKGRYLESLSQRQIRAFEGVAWMEMRSLGYDLQSSERPRLSKRDIWGFRASQFIRERFRRSMGDVQELQQRRLRDEKIKGIINRFEDAR